MGGNFKPSLYIRGMVVLVKSVHLCFTDDGVGYIRHHVSTDAKLILGKQRIIPPNRWSLGRLFEVQRPL